MTKNITSKQKHDWLPRLIAFYGGFFCFYCKIKLDIHSVIYDHLDNNRRHNVIENISLCCQSCNNKKHHNAEMQVRAMDQLKINENSNFEREREIVGEEREIATEIEIGDANFEIVEQYISERVNTDGFVEFSDALNSGAYVCRKKTNHGSKQSVRNYIDLLTSLVGPFQITKNDEKKKIIVRRAGA